MEMDRAVKETSEMERKIVFFDIDGTLINGKGEIRSSAKEAVRKLREHGNFAFLCTGRPLCTINDSVLKIGFDGIISAAGNVITKGKEIIFNNELGAGVIKKSLAILEKYSITYILEGRENLYMRDGVLNTAGQKMIDFMGEFQEKTLLYQYPEILDNISEIKISKITCTLHNIKKEMAGRLIQDMSEILFPIIHEKPLNNSAEEALTDELVEFVPLGHNKATGIERAIRYLNIPRKNTYAFGDSNNDLEMLEYVNTAVCMGNGSEKAMKAADYITDDIEEDGLYHGLEMLNLV